MFYLFLINLWVREEEEEMLNFLNECKNMCLRLSNSVLINAYVHRMNFDLSPQIMICKMLNLKFYMYELKLFKIIKCL